jgi:hypothetical protein
MLYQNPAIQLRVEVHLVEEAKGGPSKLLLSFLLMEVIMKLNSLSVLEFQLARSEHTKEVCNLDRLTHVPK